MPMVEVVREVTKNIEAEIEKTEEQQEQELDGCMSERRVLIHGMLMQIFTACLISFRPQMLCNLTSCFISNEATFA